MESASADYYTSWKRRGQVCVFVTSRDYLEYTLSSFGRNIAMFPLAVRLYM